MIAATVYVLCAATSICCAALLYRGWRRSGARLLMWSSACFGFFAVNNVLLFLDLKVFPDVDLSLARSGSAFAGAATLLLALVWDAR